MRRRRSRARSGAQTDLAAILELVAKRGRALVSARVLVIELFEGSELVIAAGAGDLPPGILGRRTPLADTMAGAAQRTRRTQRLEDELNRARFEQHGLGHLGLSASAGLVVPLVFRGESYGVLVALDRLDDGPRFRGRGRAAAGGLRRPARRSRSRPRSTASVEREAQRVAAAEQERGRWARELHDETLQGLAALRLGLASARRTQDLQAVDQAAAAAVAQLDAEIASRCGR